MTFKLPKLPSPQAKIHELADFAEIIAWEQGRVSERDIIAFLGRIDDNANNDGVSDDEEKATNLLPDVMNELDWRANACRTGYPFQLLREGTVLAYNTDNESPSASAVYRYLLLSTRLNMKENRDHAGLNGTLLLENLAAHVLKCYLGSRAKSIVFGTAEPGPFPDKVNHLCKSLREGVGYRSLDGDTNSNAVDDKLDAVAWIPFHDLAPGQLIVFGQCKTGTSWSGLETQLQPSQFSKRWFKEPFLIDPLRVFCLSESLDRSRWKSTLVSAGIIFDRCRLVDFCDGFDTKDIERWTNKAFESFSIGDLS